MADEQLILSISADVASLRRAMQKLVGDTKNQTDAIVRDFDNVGNAATRTGNKVAASNRQISDTSRQARAGALNLSFQLNDLTQGLLSGTSPFTLMAQQSSQVAQALTQAGGNVKGFFNAFKGAFSPQALAISGIILATGYAVQYIKTLVDGTKDADAVLKQHDALIRNLKSAYGEAAAGLTDYVQKRASLNVRDINADLDATKKKLLEFHDAVLAATRNLTPEDFKNNGDAIRQFNVAIEAFRLSVVAGKPDIEAFLDAMNDFSKRTDLTSAVTDAANKIFELAHAADEGEKSAVQLADSFDKLADANVKIQATFDDTFSTLRKLVEIFVGPLAQATDTYISKMKSGFGVEIKEAITTVNFELNKVLQNLEKLEVQIGKTSAAGGGKGFFGDAIGGIGEQITEGMRVTGKAAEVIRHFESFRQQAYYDVNHYRVGYGSDTFVDDMGKVRETTKDTVVTVAQAEADLANRLSQFQASIQKAIGPEFWKSLTEDQQAALTSITYNYGHLPDQIVKAIQSGGGSEKVAKAIEALGPKNTRRREEAKLFGGTGFQLDSMTAKSPEDIFSKDIAKTEANIKLKQAEYDALNKLNPLVEDYGFQTAYAEEKQRLLNEAQQAGLEITPALEKQIEGLARGYAQASANVDQLKDSQRDAARAAAEFSATAKDLLGGFIRDLRDGKSAAEAFANVLDKLADKLLDVGLDALFGGGSSKGTGIFGALFSGAGAGGGGGLLGGLLIPGILHDGGEAGKDGYGHGRSFPRSAWAGARKYASGGVAGFAPGEVPAVLHKGEIVVPTTKGMRGGQASTITLFVRGEPGPQFIPTIRAESRGVAVRVTQAGLTGYDKNLNKSLGGRIAATQARQL